MGEKRVKIEVTPETVRALATRRALGIPLRDLEGEFGFSRPVINRVLNSELGRTIQKEVIETAVRGAVLSIRRELAEMNELAMKALRRNLEENSMEAVKTYLRSLGIDTQEKENAAQTQAIQVILPGAQAPEIKDIECES